MAELQALLDSASRITTPIGLCALVIVLIAWWLKNKKEDRLFKFFSLFLSKFTKEQFSRLVNKLLTIILILAVLLLVPKIGAAVIAFLDRTISLDVVVKHNGRPVSISYELDYRTPQLGIKTAPTPQYGHTEIRGYPRADEKLDVLDLRIKGYSLKPGQGFKIENGMVTIEVIETTPAPTPILKTLPNLDPFKPSPDELSEPNKQPCKILRRSNTTSRKITLTLYYWGKTEGQFTRTIEFPLDPNVNEKISDTFSPGNGWYSVFVSEENKQAQCVGTVNLYLELAGPDAYPSIEISKCSDDVHYIARFENVRKSTNSPQPCE